MKNFWLTTLILTGSITLGIASDTLEHFDEKETEGEPPVNSNAAINHYEDENNASQSAILKCDKITPRSQIQRALREIREGPAQPNQILPAIRLEIAQDPDRLDPQTAFYCENLRAKRITLKYASENNPNNSNAPAANDGEEFMPLRYYVDGMYVTVKNKKEQEVVDNILEEHGITLKPQPEISCSRANTNVNAVVIKRLFY